MFVLCLVTYSDLTYNRHYTYPSWAIAIGWGLASCSVIMIPLVAVVRMIRTKGTLVQVNLVIYHCVHKPQGWVSATKISLYYFVKFLQSILLSLFAHLFVDLEQNSKSTPQMVKKCFGSIRTVTRKN